MPVQLSKTALDVGILSTNGPKMVSFYRDVLGLSQDPDVTIPNYGTIHKFNCGQSVLRIMVPVTSPEKASGGPFLSRDGFRYITLHVDNLDATVKACKDFGCTVPVDIRELRPGVRCAQVQDPDGNHIEFMTTK